MIMKLFKYHEYIKSTCSHTMRQFHSMGNISLISHQFDILKYQFSIIRSYAIYRWDQLLLALAYKSYSSKEFSVWRS